MEKDSSFLLTNDSNKVHIATISSAHGIKGEVKITSFTSPIENICNYNKIFDEDGNIYTIKARFIKDDKIISKVNNITSRDEVEQLRNKKLYISRSDLKETKLDEFYYIDLLNLKVLDISRNLIGEIILVSNFGSGDLIEIKFLNDKTEFFLFNKENFPEISIAEGFVIFTPPETL